MRFEHTKMGDVLVAKVLDSRILADVAPRFKHQLMTTSMKETGLSYST